eukprot:UN07977
MPRYEGGYFTPDPRHIANRHRYQQSGGGAVGVGVGVVGGAMDMNINGLHDRYYEGDDDMFEENNMNKLQNFDYGLTPSRYNKKVEVRMAVDMNADNGGHEDGECRDNNEEKTQRNDNEEPVSPLLKALKSNKSALYTNMLLPSRKNK